MNKIKDQEQMNLEQSDSRRELLNSADKFAGLLNKINATTDEQSSLIKDMDTRIDIMSDGLDRCRQGARDVSDLLGQLEVRR